MLEEKGVAVKGEMERNCYPFLAQGLCASVRWRSVGFRLGLGNG